MNHSTLRPSPRLLAGIKVVALGMIVCCTPSGSAQESVGRGRPMADGAEWVGAGVPFYNIDAATAKDGAAPKE